MRDGKCKCFDIIVYRITLSMVRKPRIWFGSFIAVCVVLTGICAIPGIGFEGPEALFLVDV